MRSIWSLTLILLFLISPGTWAQESAIDKNQSLDPKELDGLIEEWEEEFKEKPERPQTTLEKLEELHDDFSEDIDGLASRMDSFFVNENVIYGRNNTNLRVFNTFRQTEGQGTTAEVDFKVRLRLPRLKDKIQFEVDRQVDDYSVDGRGGGSSVVNNTLSRTTDPTNSQKTRAGFSFFQDLLTLQTKVTAGMEWDNGPDPYANLRLSKNFKLSRRQNIVAISNFRIEATDKTRQDNSLYYDMALRPNVLFRFLNNTVYKETTATFETLHGAFLFHELNDRNSMSYGSGVRMLNMETGSAFFVSEYFLGPSLRHRIYKRFLYFEFSPGVSWPKAENFHSVFNLTLRLEVIFGKI